MCFESFFKKKYFIYLFILDHSVTGKYLVYRLVPAVVGYEHICVYLS